MKWKILLLPIFILIFTFCLSSPSISKINKKIVKNHLTFKKVVILSKFEPFSPYDALQSLTEELLVDEFERYFVRIIPSEKIVQEIKNGYDKASVDIDKSIKKGKCENKKLKKLIKEILNKRDIDAIFFLWVGKQRVFNYESTSWSTFGELSRECEIFVNLFFIDKEGKEGTILKNRRFLGKTHYEFDKYLSQEKFYDWRGYGTRYHYRIKAGATDLEIVINAYSAFLKKISTLFDSAGIVRKSWIDDWVAQEEWDKAIYLLHAYLNDFPDFLSLYKLLAYTYLRKNDYKSAESNLQKVLRINPDDVISLGLLGESKKLSGECNNAKEIFEKVIKIDNQNAPAYYGLAGCYFKENVYDKAIEYWMKAKDLDSYYDRPPYIIRQDKFLIPFPFIPLSSDLKLLKNLLRKEKGSIFCKENL